MPGAGELTERVRFLRVAKDGHGRDLGEFELQFVRSAQIQYLRGGEPVMAQRLQGVQPVIITIRDSQAAREVTSAWRIEHARLGQVFNVTSPGKPSADRAFLDFLAQTEGSDPA